MSGPSLAPKPVVSFLKLGESGEPHLEALACTRCGKLFLDQRRHCAACGAREALAPQRLQQTGKLHAYTIVHRSLPGVKVPYVSAVVDLDGGGTVKGNLEDVPADPSRIAVGLRVRLRYSTIEREPGPNGQTRPPVATYCFVPEEKAP